MEHYQSCIGLPIALLVINVTDTVGSSRQRKEQKPANI